MHVWWHTVKLPKSLPLTLYGEFIVAAGNHVDNEFVDKNSSKTVTARYNFIRTWAVSIIS